MRASLSTGALGAHCVSRFRDGRVLAKSVRARRRVARAVLERRDEFGLLGFRLADTHLHTLLATDRRGGAEFCRRVEIALQQGRAPLPGFSRVHVTPVHSQRHLGKAFEYILDQEKHHGTDLDPLHEASIVPDLLGLRPLGRFVAEHVHRHLPRTTRTRLLNALAVSSLTPANTPVDLLPTAAEAAACIPSLKGSSPAAVEARAAVVQLAASRLRTPALAAMLGCTPRSVNRLRRRPADPNLVRAIQLQLDLRRQHRGRP